MNAIKILPYRLSSLCVFSYHENELLNSFFKLTDDNPAVALSAYSTICSTLVSRNTLLCDYVKSIVLYQTTTFLENIKVIPKEEALSAIRFDLSVFSFLCSISAQEIKKALYERFALDFIPSLPEFHTGNWDLTEQDVYNHYLTKGCGLGARYKALRFTQGKLEPIIDADVVYLSDLKEYTHQREQVIANTRFFINGLPARNVLLYGDRGTGKSSTVKALLQEPEFESLRMIQLDKSDLVHLETLYSLVQSSPLKYIIFIDDLSLSDDDDAFCALKQALEGSLRKRPPNVLIYATTNRRHIIKETSQSREENVIHKSDSIDEALSLSDRFGLMVTFINPNKDVYLKIVFQLLKDRNLSVSPEIIEAGAERYAVKKAGRSPRIARQYVDWVESRLALGMDLKE